MKMHRTPWLSACLVSAAFAAAPGLVHAQAPQDKVEGRNAYLNNAFRKVTGKARQHVVSIRSADDKQVAFGVVIEPGIVLTIASALPENDAVAVVDTMNNAHKVTAVVKDGANNIALIRITGGPSPIAHGSEKKLAIGSFVVACGTAAKPLAAGVLSARTREVAKNKRRSQNILMGLLGDGNKGHTRAYPAVIHHDAPVLPEQFGAPLLDSGGRLVGINVAAPFRGSTHAVGIDHIKTFLPKLKRGKGSVAPPPIRRPRTGPAPIPTVPPTARPWLGASLKPATKVERGVYEFGLTTTAVTGPAAKGKMQVGDVVVKIDGQTFADMDEFAGKLMAKNPGDVVTFVVIRGPGVEFTVKVKLGKK